VGRFVRINIRVLDDGFRRSWRGHFERLRGTQDCSGEIGWPVKKEIYIAGACRLNASNARDCAEFIRDFLGNLARRPAQPLGQLKCYGRRDLAHG
jgi:hypothetical protein